MLSMHFCKCRLTLYTGTIMLSFINAFLSFPVCSAKPRSGAFCFIAKVINNLVFPDKKGVFCLSCANYFSPIGKFLFRAADNSLFFLIFAINMVRRATGLLVND